MKRKIILLTGTSGFIGYNFLNFVLNKNYDVIDILRKKNKKLNRLKKKFPKNYKSIIYNNYYDLEKKINKIKVDYLINFAALYKNSHSYNDIFKFVDSNILFPSLVYDLLSKKARKIINLGSMMQHSTGKKLSSINFYSATKNAFEMISNFYSNEKTKTKFYNLKLYESFGENDNRKKLIPVIRKNYKKNKTTSVVSKNLELNIIHINDIIRAIMIVLNKNIKSGTYCLKNNKNLKIFKLINILNKDLKKKIKVRYLKKSTRKVLKSGLKLLPHWKPDKNLTKRIKLYFLNETN